MEPVVQYVAGGLFGAAVVGNGKMRMPIEEVNGLFRRFAIPAVKAALR